MKRKSRREIRHGEFEFEFASGGVEVLRKVEKDPGIDDPFFQVDHGVRDGRIDLDRQIARHGEEEIPDKGNDRGQGQGR